MTTYMEVMLRLGEFNGMSFIPDLRITLQGAVTWWIHCHDSTATCHIAGCSQLTKWMSWSCHIAGCKNSIRHIESRFSPYFILFLMQFRLWRPLYWNSTSGFHFHTSPQSTCHSVPVVQNDMSTAVPVCKILSKSDHAQQKKMTSCRFSRWRISTILDCRDPIMGSLKSPVKFT